MKGLSIYDFDELGFIFYQARQKQNLTLKQLAEKTGVSRASLCYLENGKNRLSFHKIEKLADALRLDLRFCVVKN